MTESMRYLSASQLAQVCADSTGMLVDEGALQRVVEGSLEAGLHAAAAALAVGIVRERPFASGNHDAALVAVVVFYADNGWSLDVADGDTVADLVDKAGRRELSAKDVAARLGELVRRRAASDPSEG